MLDPGAVAAGNLAGATDRDVFRIDVERRTDFVIFTTGDVDTVDTVGAVVDNAGVFIAAAFPSSGHFVIRDRLDAGRYYVFVGASDGDGGDYELHVVEDTDYADFLMRCAATATIASATDPLHGCQWHIKNDLMPGQDINVEPVWSTYTGAGIRVAVVDDGMHFDHEDLRGGVNASRNRNYCPEGDALCSVQSIYTPVRDHGTQVAGIIAARENGLGVRGVAPGATIYGHNVVVDSSAANEADAMTRNMAVTAVSNNSWGPRDAPGYSAAPSTWTVAVDSGVSQGFGGKGVVYVWAGGNGGTEWDNSNLDEYANYYGVTAVCAVNDGGVRSRYSEMGANLWVCGPSSDRDTRGIVTTDNRDRYAEQFGGTSAAAPMVSGVVALVRQANEGLTWRDVKLILAASTRKNDATNGSWEDGARKYGSDGERYAFSHEYGFGVVDAASAVELATNWVSLPPMTSVRASSTDVLMGIPDESQTVTTALDVSTAIDFIEFVEINVTLTHPDIRDLQVELESPSGTVSSLMVACPAADCQQVYPVGRAVRLGSARHLGETPSGTWKLHVADNVPGSVGMVVRWEVVVYGHEGQ